MFSEDYVPDPAGAYVLRGRCPRSMTGHLSSDNYEPVSTEACTFSVAMTPELPKLWSKGMKVEEKKKNKVRIRMVIDGVLEKFDDIALDCKYFQADDIYTFVLGNEIVDVHVKYVPSSM